MLYIGTIAHGSRGGNSKLFPYLRRALYLLKPLAFLSYINLGTTALNIQRNNKMRLILT